MDLNKISINSYILTHPGSLENTIEVFVKGKCLRFYYLEVYFIWISWGRIMRWFIQRIFWTIIFCMGGFFASYFILGIWQKWIESPVYMSVETTSHHVSNIPFPAVSICSVNKIQVRYPFFWKSKILKYSWNSCNRSTSLFHSNYIGSPSKEVLERPCSGIRISSRNTANKIGKYSITIFSIYYQASGIKTSKE